MKWLPTGRPAWFQQSGTDLAGDPLQLLDRAQVVRRRPAETHLVERPGQRLEVVGAERAAGAAGPVLHGPGLARAPQVDEGRGDRVAVQLGGGDLEHLVAEL